MPRIIIVGRGGSGKDFLKKKYENANFTTAISHTTRPRRSNEIYGRDYFYVTETAFRQFIANGDLQEFDQFNGWFYGTSLYEWNSSQIFIKTPRGVEKIDKDDRKNCLIIYLDIAEDIRRERLLKRQDADDVERRIQADERDFKDFKDYDVRIDNPFF